VSDEQVSIYLDPTVGTKVTQAKTVEARRRELVRVGRELFCKKGYYKSSVRDVAGGLGWNMGTLYLYITSKEDILYLCSREILNEMWGAVEAVPFRDSHWTHFSDVFRRLCDYVDQNKSEINMVYRESGTTLSHQLRVLKDRELQSRRFIADIIDAGIAAKEFRPSIDSGIAAGNVVFQGHAWALKWWSMRRQYTVDQYVEAQLELFAGAIRLPD
jgi:AcrR family transcriptional regulator